MNKLTTSTSNKTLNQSHLYLLILSLELEMAICKVSIAVVFVAWLATVHCHTYYLGSCPRVEPMNDFDMEKVHLKRVVNLQIKRN